MCNACQWYKNDTTLVSVGHSLWYSHEQSLPQFLPINTVFSTLRYRGNVFHLIVRGKRLVYRKKNKNLHKQVSSGNNPYWRQKMLPKYAADYARQQQQQGGLCRTVRVTGEERLVISVSHFSTLGMLCSYERSHNTKKNAML